MEEIRSLIGRRSQPGILVLSQNGKILYQNQCAFKIIDSIREKQLPDDLSNRFLPSRVLSEIYPDFKERMETKKEGWKEQIPFLKRVFSHGKVRYHLRSIPLPGGDRYPTYLMILIEPVS